MESQGNFFYARPLENWIFKETYGLFMEPGMIKKQTFKNLQLYSRQGKGGELMAFVPGTRKRDVTDSGVLIVLVNRFSSQDSTHENR